MAKLKKGENDLASRNPELALEWNYSKNKNINPDEICYSSNKKVWWICQKGHEWFAAPNGRRRGTGCPYCANDLIIPGENDLATIRPELAQEWNTLRNGDILPQNVSCRTNRKVWWLGKCGHEWQATIASRSDGHGCPYCSGRLVLAGMNDLASQRPDIAHEWHTVRNKELLPEMIALNSNKKVWWLGKCGHEWQATVANRTSRNSRCPICQKEYHTSFPEQVVFYYLSKIFPDAINGDLHLGLELDIYIPSLKTAIEYDGKEWHNRDISKNNERTKNAMCRKNGIRLIRIRESGLDSYDDCECIFRENMLNNETLSQVLHTLLETLKVNVDIDLNRDLPEINQFAISARKEKNLATQNPTLALEWNYAKNGKLTPEMITPHSRTIVWWRCKNGHEYQMAVGERNRGEGRQRGCPYCSGRRLLSGYNDLLTVYPDIAQDWDAPKNTTAPSQVAKSSKLNVWWKCQKCGFEWESTVNSRTSKKRGCPRCGNGKGKN